MNERLRPNVRKYPAPVAFPLANKKSCNNNNNNNDSSDNNNNNNNDNHRHRHANGTALMVGNSNIAAHSVRLASSKLN